MGTDIHFYVEVLRNGQWVSADKWKPAEWLEEGEEPYNVVADPYYNTRNSHFFAILTDIYNRDGVREYVTNPINFIAPRKGLPPDVSLEVQKARDSYGYHPSIHSDSWLTLDEILKYDWTQIHLVTGVHANSLDIFYRMLEGKWSWQSTYFPTLPEVYKWVSEQEMEKMILEVTGGSFTREAENKVREQLFEYACMISFYEPYYRLAVEFWAYTLPRLLRLGDPQDIRIVFWFDS